MKKVQIGNTNYEVNINYAEKGESLQRLIEILAYHRVKKEQENSEKFVEDSTR